MSCFVASGVVAPVAHQVWHRPGHAHGPSQRTTHEWRPAVVVHGSPLHGDEDHQHPHRHHAVPRSGPAHDHRPARHSHDHGAPAGQQHDHSPSGLPDEPDHGQRSISHFALAMLGAAPAPVVAEPAEVVAAPPAPAYESLRGHVIRPRAPRAPPA